MTNMSRNVLSLVLALTLAVTVGLAARRPGDKS